MLFGTEAHFPHEESTEYTEPSESESTICHEQTCEKVALDQKNNYHFLKKTLTTYVFLALILMIIILPQALYSMRRKIIPDNYLRVINTTIVRE